MRSWLRRILCPHTHRTRFDRLTWGDGVTRCDHCRKTWIRRHTP